MDTKILSVEKACFHLTKSNPPQLVIQAVGTVNSTGWSDGRLLPWMYIRQPPDGIIDFEFVAKAPSGFVLWVLAPIEGIGAVPLQPWIKGFRIHAATNELEVMLSEKSGLVEGGMPGIDYWKPLRRKDTMNGQQENPNNYRLHGSGTTISYDTTGIVGTSLHYDDGTLAHTFLGEEIRTLETELGLLVSGTLKQDRDGDSLTVNLLVPVVNLPDGEAQAIRTVAILCTQAGTLGGPNLVPGQVQEYRVVSLEGMASLR